MDNKSVKFWHNIAGGVLMLALLMGSVAAGRGDISGKTLLIGWSVLVALFLGSYTYFSLTGKIDAENK